MDERQLGEAMLIFEANRQQNLRPPLPCDGKLITQQYKRWNRTDVDLLADQTQSRGHNPRTV